VQPAQQELADAADVLSLSAQLQSSASEAARSESGPPLCVDLDGTLIRGDLLWESLLALLGRNPLYVFVLPVWLSMGRANLKRQVSSRVKIDARTLPYHHEFVQYLRAQKDQGRRLVLVTAADYELAAAVAGHLNIFSEILASDGVLNLKGAEKRAALDRRFGPGGYDYAGNSKADVEVWRGARGAILVNAGASIVRLAAAVSGVDLAFGSTRPGWRPLARALRVHQWAKNLLLFLPVFTSHKILDGVIASRAALAFGAFSLCASSVYVLNDLLDLNNDRLHAIKKMRPFARGDLSIPFGLTLAAVLLAGSAGVSLWLPGPFQAVLGVYYVLTLCYSLFLKRRLLLDVFTLGGLYAIRVLAGSAATGIEPSPWLLAFCLFFFLSLALVKRFTELRRMEERPGQTVSGRDYHAADQLAIGSLGTSSGFMCVLVLALYINSPAVLDLYRVPWMLWFLCPIALYWISRVWIFAYRGELSEDPVLFALRDRVSYLAAGCSAAVLMLATRGMQFLR